MRQTGSREGIPAGSEATERWPPARPLICETQQFCGGATDHRNSCTCLFQKTSLLRTPPGLQAPARRAESCPSSLL